MNSILSDIRYALRILAKSPGFTAVAVLTLALGIGANTAIFSLINGVLMRSLPVQDASSLVVLKWSAHRSPDIHNSSSYGDCGRTHLSRDSDSSGCSFSEPFFHDVAAHVGSFSHVAAFASGGQLDLSGNGTASVLHAEAVTGDFFNMLGVRPAAGRLIAPADDSVSVPPVAVLNYGYWKSEFGGSLSAVGKTVRLNNVPFTIIGVADPQFDSLSPGNPKDIWVPLSVEPLVNPSPEAKTRAADAYSWWLVIVGRLKPGVAPLQAQAEVSTLFRNDMLHGAKPLSKPQDDPRVAALPGQSGLSGETAELAPIAYVLMLAVGIVLLIACANLAGLLLSRASVRQKEIAVRLALGARRGRVVRQLLTESVLLSLVGGGLGVLFAIWGTEAIMSLMTAGSDRPFPFDIGFDGRVLAFTLAVSVLTGIVFGLAPAFRGTRMDLTPVLKEGSRSSTGEGARGWLNLGDGLVVAQVALAVVVLVGAGLLVRTLQNLRNVDPGFDTRNLLTFSLNPTLIGYKTPQIDTFYRDLQQRLESIPGVESVSYSNSTLLSGDLWTTGFHLAGTPKDHESDADYLPVGADFFSTMHMQLLAGRNFTTADFAQAQVAQEARDARRAAQEALEAGNAKPSGAGAAASASSAANEAPVPVIVNKTFVQKYFSKVNPIGLRFGQAPADPAKGEIASPGWVIDGVVSDAKYEDLRGAVQPTMYVPSSGLQTSFVLRTARNVAALTPAIRGIVSQMDSNLPVFNVHTQTQLIDQLLIRERMIGQLSGFFGIVALVLACIGLYGLLAYQVARRTREIGIRMALGAERHDVLRLVVRQGIVLAVVGAACGAVVAFWATRYLASMLFDVRSSDPLTYVGVAVLLCVVALLACYIPARRASRVDPMVALRYE